MQAAGRDAETPWLLWTKVFQRLMATWPTMPRYLRDVEQIANGCSNHSMDAVRYGGSGIGRSRGRDQTCSPSNVVDGLLFWIGLLSVGRDRIATRFVISLQRFQLLPPRNYASEPCKHQQQNC